MDGPLLVFEGDGGRKKENWKICLFESEGSEGWPPGRLSCEGAQAPCFSSSLRKDNAWRRTDWNWKANLESRAVIFVFGVQTVNNNSPLDH